MQKRRLYMALALVLSLVLLSSCRFADSLRQWFHFQPISPSTDTDRAPDSSVPVWSADQTYAAAMTALEDPAGGIVDISVARYSYNALCEDLAALAERYSFAFSYRSLGQTAAGREIWLAVLGNPQAKRQVVVSAAIHAREYLTAQLTMRQLEFYLANYDCGTYGGASYRTLFEEICFYIVPMTNPDGVMLAQEGLDSLPTVEMRNFVQHIFETEGRANGYKTLSVFLSHWKANARGVDLNRNYDALWAEYSKGPDAPASYQYKGDSPGSEAETRALTALIEGLTDPVAVLCMHSQGEVIYWNCGQAGDVRTQTQAYAAELAERTGYRMVDDRNNDASLSDWAALRQGLVSVTVEMGLGKYPLPLTQLYAMWQSNYDLLPLTAAYFAR